jgi:hypothetical protein
MPTPDKDMLIQGMLSAHQTEMASAADRENATSLSYWTEAAGRCQDCGKRDRHRVNHPSGPLCYACVRERILSETVEQCVDVQGIAAIAWRCIKQCKDHEGPPVMCPAHQEEAEALVGAK